MSASKKRTVLIGLDMDGVLTKLEGELEELFEDFNDGRVQFALVKVKDTNTKLGKNVFIAWVRICILRI